MRATPTVTAIAQLGNLGLAHAPTVDSVVAVGRRIGAGFVPICRTGPVYNNRPYIEVTEAVNCPDCLHIQTHTD